MLAGEYGRARQKAIRHQLPVGEFFDAEDLVPVAQAPIMADTKPTAESGLSFLEDLASLRSDQCRVRVPTITDPRGVDFEAYKRLGQTEQMADLEKRAVRAFETLPVLMTNTCINYQTISSPIRGEHLAFGDTGIVIYSNAILGGGPSALAAALTGRTPRYGYHIPEEPFGTRHFDLADSPDGLSDWGALGGIVGQATNSYWEVPLITGVDNPPTSDELMHFGAALASFGSVAMFHIPGVTPEAATLAEAFDGSAANQTTRIGRHELSDFYRQLEACGDKVDVVVFAAPQLSLLEMKSVAGLLEGKRIHEATSLIVATSPEIRFAADRMGNTATIEKSGGLVLAGVCFYQSYTRELAETNGWKRLVSNSAKLINIIGGYGY